MNKNNTFGRFKEEEFEDTYELSNTRLFKSMKSVYGDGFFEHLKMFVFSEHVMSVTYKVMNKESFTLDDIEAVLSGFGENFVKHKDIYFFDDISIDERMIIKTYWFFKTYISNFNFINMIENYLKNSDCFDGYKLFKLDEDNIVPVNKSNLIKNKRYKKYIEISSLPMPLNKSEESSDDIKIGILNNYINNKVEESISRNSCNKIKSKYKEVNEILKSLNIEDLTSKMDELIVKNLKKEKGHYKETINKISIFKYNGKKIIDINSNLLTLQGVYTHLAGKTGAGKSVQIDTILKALSDNKKRVLIITPNHAISFKNKQTCEVLDIPNVMLMGRNREEYMKVFYESMYSINNKRGDNRDSLSYLTKSYSLFKDMSTGCTNLDAKDIFEYEKNKRYDENNHFYKPCSRCKEPNTCSFARPYREAFTDDVNVIIAPIQTLCKTKLMSNLDNERRTLLEDLMLTVDLVIVDEVDEIQSITEGVYSYKDVIYSNDSQQNSSKIEGTIEYYKDIFNNMPRSIIAEQYQKLNAKLHNLDDLINFIGKWYLSPKTIELIENEIKIGSSFDEDTLILHYLKKYIYASIDIDKEVLSDKARKMSRILKSEKSLSFLKDKVDFILNKYVRNENDSSSCMITEDDDKFKNTLFYKLFDGYFETFGDLFKEECILILNNKGHKNKSENRNAIKFLIFIFLILVLKIDYNNFMREAELKINISKRNKTANSELPSLTKSLLNNIVCGFVIDIDNIESRKGDKIEISKYGKLKIFKYDGIGREVLLNTNKYLSVLYGVPTVPMLICSATSLDTKSSLYTIKYPVNLVLENSDQKSKKNTLKPNVKVYCHVFSYNGKLCATSGDYENRVKNTKETCIAMKDFIKDTVETARVKNEGVLLVSPSSNISYVIYDSLKELHPEMNIKVLYTKSHERPFSPEMHVDRNSIEQCASNSVDILIAVNQTIARGFNILKDVDGERDKSYFTDIIMFNRFLPSPEDYLSHISFAHILIEKEFKKADGALGKSYKDVVKKANKYIGTMKYLEGFNQMPSEIKEMIIGNVFCLLEQIKGRGQRGGSECRIHLIDSKAYPKTALAIKNKKLSKYKLSSSLFRTLDEDEQNYDDSNSLMQGLINILNQEDILVDILFDVMKEAFNNHIFISHIK